MFLFWIRDCGIEDLLPFFLELVASLPKAPTKSQFIIYFILFGCRENCGEQNEDENENEIEKLEV